MAGLAAVTLAAGTAQATLVHWSVFDTSSSGGITLSGVEKDLNLTVGVSITEPLINVSYIANSSGPTVPVAFTYSSLSEKITAYQTPYQTSYPAIVGQELTFTVNVITISDGTIPGGMDIVQVSYDKHLFSFDLGTNLKLLVDLKELYPGESISRNGPPGPPLDIPISATLTLIAVPEPSTVVAGILVLLPFGVSSIRSIRKNRL